LAVLMSLVFSSSHAPAHASENDGGNGYFEITGLVIEETMTPAGHNLYESFNARWKPMEGLSYTITVKERADSVRGSFYQFLVDEDVVLAGRLNPSIDFIDELAAEAVKRCSFYILQREFVSEELEFY
jgi:hypothetical protein